MSFAGHAKLREWSWQCQTRGRSGCGLGASEDYREMEELLQPEWHFREWKRGAVRMAMRIYEGQISAVILSTTFEFINWSVAGFETRASEFRRRLSIGDNGE